MDIPPNLIEKLLLHEARMEVLVAELLDSKLLEPSSLLIRARSTFRRGYSRDIMGAELIPPPKNATKTAPTLALDLSRDGLYDHLPEFVFHEPEVPVAYKTHEQRLKKSEQVRDEEVNSRKFFLPFEQEFFRKKIQVELLERKLISINSSPIQEEVFEKFWTSVSGVEPPQRAMLFYLLPLVHKIVGNMALMQSCFEVVLKEKVTLRKKKMPQADFDRCHAPQLGEAALGADFIVGGSTENELSMLEVSIGPLELTSMPDYIENGKKHQLLTILYDYFVPLELDVETKILLEEAANGFTISAAAGTGRLGFSTFV
ncbi:MAG: type VI secretion system baseplate subunit TssG [Saprospiraceae bacterium]|nr:type VI secretion system baseplate subunit TssG [Saprospiraceae bacterium]